MAAGITDVRRSASRFSVPSHRPRNTQVASLAELSEEELDKFDMRKLEKRKLLHHLSGVAVPKGDDSIMC